MTEPKDGVFDPDEIEAARVLFSRQADFVMGCVAIDGLPAPDLPEVAFEIGRAHV